MVSVPTIQEQGENVWAQLEVVAALWVMADEGKLTEDQLRECMEHCFDYIGVDLDEDPLPSAN